MSALTALLPAVVPVAFIILIGILASRVLPLELQTLNQLTVYILAPALVADGLYQTTLSVQSAAGLLIGFTLISLLMYGLVWLISKFLKLSSDTHKSLLATSLLPNNGNMGLPVIAFALGEQGLERAIIYMIGSSILLFGIAPALLKGNGFNYGLRLTLKLPLIWAMIGGLSLRLFSIQLPLGLDTAIEQLGASAIPLALIILGMQLSHTNFQLRKYEILATGMRLFFAPLMAYGVGIILGLQGLDLQVLILQTAMPAAVNSVVLVTEFGGDANKVARTIVVTTIASFWTLPIVLWLSNPNF
ncbi:Auxin Efflux Carrier [Gloeothece citriformis PCC 7424]|uniref:Auxin Efflux Carrier n=1 Tax=Gloeothece citriformis (strain PCC 7424) TaxID=65393 RepID=B7KCU1_GLOC7|nr:AEC family transporter [Gloeothece citriformis]ACK71642.1 Auxin Efflux Carrier [Gloeothece citriformis PCC 7424]